MYQPQLFREAGIQALSDALYVLKKYFKPSYLKNKCKVLDVGCGPGNITHDILYPLLPPSALNLVGIDISAKMVNFAREQYQINDKISFYEMDILTEKIPKNFQNEFDYVFSLYCLHMVDNHRKALSNVFKMLKPGGSILLSYQAKCTMYDIYKEISKIDHWRAYMKNYERLIPFTQLKEDPVSCYIDLLKEIGFKSIQCFSEDKVFEYSEQSFKNTLLAVNVFNIPKDKEDQFALDHIKYLKDTNNFKIDNDNIILLFPYTLMVVLATRPLY